MGKAANEQTPQPAPAQAPSEPATAPANVPQADDEKPAGVTPPEAATVKEIEVDGYKFKVDMDLMDDVEAFEYVDRIENKGQISAIVPLLQFMIGEKGTADMKAHFVKKYGRFRLTKLMNVYEAIAANFDPKG